MVTRIALVALVACSGSKRTAGEDAMKTARDGATVSPDGSATPDPPAPPGEAAIRVEWKSVPVAARQSPGRTPCNTPRPAAVAPATMWGIPDAIVLVDKAAPPGEVRIVVSACTLAPRVAIAGTLIVESALDRPAKLILTKHGTIAAFGALAPADARAIQLPIAGHAVSIALDAGAIYQLAIDGADTEPSWIVAAPGAVTDVAGLATIKLPAGAHGVTAWLPARGGQASRVIKSSVTVESEQLAEIAIDLGAAP